VVARSVPRTVLDTGNFLGYPGAIINDEVQTLDEDLIEKVTTRDA